jgi:hypothetical protein
MKARAFFVKELPSAASRIFILGVSAVLDGSA